MMDITLPKISNQRYTCIIVGDLNIDLLQWDTQKPIRNYLDTVTTNNFMPLLMLPTRVTSISSTLIDHVYYFENKKCKGIKTRETTLCDKFGGT